MKTANRGALAFLVLPALLLAACATAGAPTSGPTALGGRGAAGGVAVAEPASMPAPQARPELGAAKPADAAQVHGIPVPQVFDPDRALILTANVSLKATDPWSVSDRVQAIAIGLGGDVLSLAQSGSGEHRSAMLTLRVPQARFNDALRQVRDIADIEVVSSNVDGKDVTDQFIDLQARLTAKKAEEQRYLALLARAEKIDDILKIDQVLSNVRAQIEQLQGQLNALKNRSSLATITVSVGPLGLTQQPPQTSWQPGRTFLAASAALLGFLQRVADLAIWMVVWIWIPALALGFALALGRLVRPRQSPS